VSILLGSRFCKGLSFSFIEHHCLFYLPFACRSSVDTMKTAQQGFSVDDVADMHDDLFDMMADVSEMNEILSRPMDSYDTVNESDLDAALAGLDDELGVGDVTGVSAGAGAVGAGASAVDDTAMPSYLLPSAAAPAPAAAIPTASYATSYPSVPTAPVAPAPAKAAPVAGAAARF
jgi:Snf7